jgi:hypothetical protein
MVLLSAGAAPLPAMAQPDQANAVEPERKDRGSIELSLRWRFEEVSSDAFDKDGRASTLRSTLLYRTPLWRDLGAVAEFEDVHDVGLDDEHANAGAGGFHNRVLDRPVIADPELAEVNQAFARYQGVEGLVADAGRMEILLADEPFVGPVGFRQNHQSFDGARLTLTRIPRTTAFYGFIGNVNRINGGNDGMESHLVDVAIDTGRWGKVAPYFYLLDYDGLDNAGLSSSTWGARWDGTFSIGTEWSLPIHVQAATQRDAGDNPAELDAGYSRIEASLSRKSVSFGLGREVLGGDPTDGAFQTPLATLHKFNGAADQFLLTPPDGLVDLWATASGKVGALSWVVALHDFEADAGSASYGSELDAELTWKSRWSQLFGVKYASYDADSFSTDTDKLWIFTTYRFAAEL